MPCFKIWLRDLNGRVHRNRFEIADGNGGVAMQREGTRSRTPSQQKNVMPCVGEGTWSQLHKRKSRKLRLQCSEVW